MTDPGKAIGEAYAAIVREADEDQMRAQYRAAMRIIREIPSGTPDSELTNEQRAAWRAHDAAIAWLNKHR